MSVRPLPGGLKPDWTLVAVGWTLAFWMGCGDASDDKFADSIRRITWTHFENDTYAVLVDTDEPSGLSLSFRTGTGLWQTVSDPERETSHQLEAHGLPVGVPEVTYHLSAADGGDGEPSGESLQLRTLDRGADEVSGLLFADAQGGDFASTLEEASEEANSQFLLFLGDFVSVGADPATAADAAYVEYMLRPLSVLTRRMPLYSVFGNHDAGHTESEQVADAALREFRKYLAPPPGASSDLGVAYSFDLGPLHVAVLDSVDRSKPKSHGRVSEEQLAWLVDDMSQNDEPWKVVALHHQVHGWESTADSIQADWFHVENFEAVHDAIVRSGVALVLQGHRHAVNRYDLDGVAYVTVPTLSAGEILFDRYGTANFENVGGDFGSFAHAFGEVFGFASMTATRTELRIDFVVHTVVGVPGQPLAIPSVLLVDP